MKQNTRNAIVLGAVAIAVTFGMVALMSTPYDTGLATANHGDDNKIYDHPFGDLDEYRVDTTLTPYNAAVRDAFFIEYDFEADFHPHVDTITGQVVSLMVHKEKHAGTYNPTEAERRYHDFIMEFEADYMPKPTIPDTVEEVDEALISILGHADHMYRVESLYDSFNKMANMGHVHDDLFFDDEEFWGLVFVVSACEYETPDVDCDAFPSIIAANRDLTEEEIAEVER